MRGNTRASSVHCALIQSSYQLPKMEPEQSEYQWSALLFSVSLTIYRGPKASRMVGVA